MTLIRRKEVYMFEGKQYNSPDEVKTEIENRLGKIIDRATLLDPRQKLQIMDALIGQKETVRALLSIEIESDDWTVSNTNILDWE